VDDPFEKESAIKAGYKSNVILHSKYDAVDTTTVVKQQKHLSQSQKEDLTKLLSKYSKLFSGKLGKYSSLMKLKFATAKGSPVNMLFKPTENLLKWNQLLCLAQTGAYELPVTK
jgi:hypothetical protein